jgi:hypothetical protein
MTSRRLVAIDERVEEGQSRASQTDRHDVWTSERTSPLARGLLQGTVRDVDDTTDVESRGRGVKVAGSTVAIACIGLLLVGCFAADPEYSEAEATTAAVATGRLTNPVSGTSTR